MKDKKGFLYAREKSEYFAASSFCGPCKNLRVWEEKKKPNRLFKGKRCEKGSISRLACSGSQRAVLVSKRSVSRNFKICTQSWQISIQAKMWPIKEKQNRQLLAKSYPLQQAAGMRRYNSLININPSGGSRPRLRISAQAILLGLKHAATR